MQHENQQSGSHDSTEPDHLIIALVGPSGCGKTAVGEVLAQKIRARFLDADDFHTPENKARMKAGAGLTDDLRRPWLAKVRQAAETASRDSVVVVACSALKPELRRQLRHDSEAWKFVSLEVDAETLMHRLTTRQGHFFPASLLRDQLVTWKPLSPEEGFAVNGAWEIDRIVQEIRRRLNLD
jgi:gluconokinase